MLLISSERFSAAAVTAGVGDAVASGVAETDDWLVLLEFFVEEPDEEDPPEPLPTIVVEPPVDEPELEDELEELDEPDPDPEKLDWLELLFDEPDDELDELDELPELELDELPARAGTPRARRSAATAPTRRVRRSIWFMRIP